MLFLNSISLAKHAYLTPHKWRESHSKLLKVKLNTYRALNVQQLLFCENEKKSVHFFSSLPLSVINQLAKRSVRFVFSFMNLSLNCVLIISHFFEFEFVE